MKICKLNLSCATHQGLKHFSLAVALLASACGNASSEQIGTVDTVFKFIGPDHKIVVEAYDDPKVIGITCYVSRAKTGGIKGAFGLAEDRAEASIACRRNGDSGEVARPRRRFPRGRAAQARQGTAFAGCARHTGILKNRS